MVFILEKLKEQEFFLKKYNIYKGFLKQNKEFRVCWKPIKYPAR